MKVLAKRVSSDVAGVEVCSSLDVLNQLMQTNTDILQACHCRKEFIRSMLTCCARTEVEVGPLHAHL